MQNGCAARPPPTAAISHMSRAKLPTYRVRIQGFVATRSSPDIGRRTAGIKRGN